MYDPTKPRKAMDLRPFERVRREPADATATEAMRQLLAMQEQMRRPGAGTMGVPSGLMEPTMVEKGIRLGAEVLPPVSIPEMWRGLKQMVGGDVREGAGTIGTELLLAGATGGFGNKARKLKSVAELAGGTAAKEAADAALQRAQRAVTAAPGKPRGQERFGVLTAENMGGEPGRPAQNRAAMAALDRSLQRRGLAEQTVPVTGAYTDDVTGKTLQETGRLIPGIGPQEIENLGRQFRQNSVLSERGLHDLAGGRVIPSSRTLPATGMPFTELPGGQRIVLDLDWDKSKPLADVAPGLSRYAPGAPSIILPPSSGTVLNEANLGRIVPPMARMQRAPVRYPVDPDWNIIDQVAGNFRKNYTPAVLRGIKDEPKSLGWYDTTELARLFEDYAPSGLDDFKLAMRLTSPPSAGTRVFPENLRMGSWAYEQAKKGNLTPAVLEAGRLDLPEGYRHRYQKTVNKGWRDILDKGRLDPFEQPKTYRHAEIPALEDWMNIALDRHVGRTVGLPGMLPNPKTGLYDTPGVGYPEPSYGVTRQINTSPANSQYALIEDALLDESARLGLPAPMYMASGWVGNAAQTGVDDTRTLVELYNEMFRRTGNKYGLSPLEAAKAWAGGQLPLWALGGVTAGTAANAARGKQEKDGGKKDF